MNNKIKPIETEYNGYRFRSRLEARWAIFFDSVGIKYRYEVEGYELGNGKKYLPDFYLPDVIPRFNHEIRRGIYVEVKGDITQKDLDKIESFAYPNGENGVPENPVLVVGDILKYSPWGDEGKFCNDYNDGYPYYNHYMIDGDNWPCFFDRLKNGEWVVTGPQNWSIWDVVGFDFSEHLKKARYARFEHGECG